MPHLSHDDLTRTIFPVAAELTGGRATKLETLPGGASIRRYHRITIDGGNASTLVVMELGDNPLKSEEAGKGAAPTELPFINIQRYLARAGASVPAIHRFDAEGGFLYLEDLGDVTFESRVSDANDDVRARYYRAAIAQLVALQRYAAEHPDNDCIAFSRGFDYDLLKWELDHFREYGLEAQGHQPSPSEREELERIFKRIAEELAAEPRGFVHRDYQSRNLMVQDSSIGPRLRIIDFQDALLGTRAYDLVGLLRDSYVALSPSLLDGLVSHYVAEAGAEAAKFGRLFDLQVVQRKLKDAGRFVFIDRVKKNPSFLAHIPNSLEYVARSLSRLPELESLREILAHHLECFR
ncbi:MAG: phosphotransferase [Myxococcales bacterium]|nr:phosphotransferase [Myxococcales bacterium]